MKYRPSVDRAALLKEIIAVPAEPEKPEINSAMKHCELGVWTEMIEGGYRLTSAAVARRNVLGLVAIF